MCLVFLLLINFFSLFYYFRLLCFFVFFFVLFYTSQSWNASQRQPLDTVRVTNVGINAIFFGLGTKRALCACVDGSISVYHMQKMQIEFSTCAGHTETIFDCHFSPQSPDILATASYDGTVKIWSMSDLSLQKTLHGPSDVFQAICTTPKDVRIVLGVRMDSPRLPTSFLLRS